MPFRSLVLAGAAAATAIGPLASAAAGASRPSERLIGPDLVDEVRAHLDDDIVVLMLRAINAERAHMDTGEVDALDRRWRTEREDGQKPLIASTLSNPLSNHLTRLQAHSGGLYTEIIVVGRKGLNVGQSTVTTDMWQGDEAKFERTFAVGEGAVFVDKAEWHEPSGTWRAQLNLTIDDPDGGAPLGAATFEINLTELGRRLSRGAMK